MAPDITTPTATTAATKPPTGPNRAYITFLAGGGDDWKGVVGLAKGLRKVNSEYLLVVAMLPDVPEEHRRILISQGCVLREIDPVYPPSNQTQFTMAYYVIKYSKLRIWEFVEYSKMIYVDADTQVFGNIDHLFDCPDEKLHAVLDCFCDPTWSSSPQFKLGYCQQRPDKVQWDPNLGPTFPWYFNAGMFVYEPSLKTYHDLLRSLPISPITSFAEQDFLNVFFRHEYMPISSNNHLVLPMLWLHPENIQLDQVKVVQYCAQGSKPWRYTGEEENMDREDVKMLVKKWWDIYDDESLDYKNTVATLADAQPFNAVALSEAGVPDVLPPPSAT